MLIPFAIVFIIFTSPIWAPLIDKYFYQPELLKDAARKAAEDAEDKTDADNELAIEIIDERHNTESSRPGRRNRPPRPKDPPVF